MDEPTTASFIDDLRVAYFGDARLTRRLGLIASAIAAKPSASLPVAMGTEASLEGTYRFLNNRRVTFDEILAPHAAATAARAGEHAVVRLIHDTTECDFPGESRRAGLGRTSGKRQGFFAHATLVTTAEATPLPLGVLAVQPYTRAEERAPRQDRRNSGRNGEFARWEQQARLTDDQLPPGVRAVHIMDREADAYVPLASLTESSFVVRAKSDRVVYAPGDPHGESWGALPDVAAAAPVVVSRTVRLSRRSAQGRARTSLKEHPPREERLARLAIAATTVVLRRSQAGPKDVPPTLEVHVVHVRELDPPEGEEPIEWMLLTNLSIDTREDIEAIVDHYRGRWLIEEFFKALKTGCGLEALQLESYDALLNTMAIFVPVAAQMLVLRTIDRTQPEAPATTVLTERQVKVLRSIAHLKLPARPTVHQALLAIARLGGHLKRNGPPGWLTLSRGFRDLRLLEYGWAAREEM
jgi:hypothetical protein